MGTQWVADYPNSGAPVDKRPRKRARLGWDVPPPLPPPRILPPLYCRQEILNGTNVGQLPHPFYYTGIPRNLSPPWRADDKDGHFVFELGETLTPRYRILSKMGEGTFGQVLECWDMDNKETVAIKIVRSLHKYREAAMIEIDVLSRLAEADTGGTRYLKSLDPVYMISSRETAIAPFQSTLFGTLADNFWSLWHLCMTYGLYTLI